MADLVGLVAKAATGITDLTNMEKVLREQRLVQAAQQLQDIDELTRNLSAMGEELTSLTGLPDLPLKMVKPLQEKTRIATALIRNHIYLNGMRAEAEKTALEALGPVPDLEKEAEAAPEQNKEETREGASEPTIPPEDTPPESPAEHIASMARLKKNQRRRQLYQGKKKNKSYENETIETTLAALEADLAKTNALADEARQAVIATPPNLTSP